VALGIGNTYVYDTAEHNVRAVGFSQQFLHKSIKFLITIFAQEFQVWHLSLESNAKDAKTYP
jgi:hypothetical protein